MLYKDYDGYLIKAYVAVKEKPCRITFPFVVELSSRDAHVPLEISHSSAVTVF